MFLLFGINWKFNELLIFNVGVLINGRNLVIVNSFTFESIGEEEFRFHNMGGLTLSQTTVSVHGTFKWTSGT